MYCHFLTSIFEFWLQNWITRFKILKKNSRRSKLEINVAILRVLARHGPLKLTHIMYKSNVNCTVLKEFLDFLSQQNLIEETVVRKKKRQKTVYDITERGRIALTYFKEITRALQPTEELQRSYVFIWAKPLLPEKKMTVFGTNSCLLVRSWCK